MVHVVQHQPLSCAGKRTLDVEPTAAAQDEIEIITELNDGTHSHREMETRKTLDVAEERRWECEYHLAENENTRLRHDIDSLETRLHAIQFDITQSDEYQMLSENYQQTLFKLEELEKELDMTKNCT